MKTQKEGGRYDFARRAFATLEDMAYFLGRSPSYVQARLTGGAEFTERETELLNKAVRFYDRTDIEPVRYQKMQRRAKDNGAAFVYSMAWTMISGGFNMRYSVEHAREIAITIYPDIPPADDILGQIYEKTMY